MAFLINCCSNFLSSHPGYGLYYYFFIYIMNKSLQIFAPNIRFKIL